MGINEQEWDRRCNQIADSGYGSLPNYRIIPVVPGEIYRETQHEDWIARRDANLSHFASIRGVPVAGHEIDIDPPILQDAPVYTNRSEVDVRVAVREPVRDLSVEDLPFIRCLLGV